MYDANVRTKDIQRGIIEHIDYFLMQRPLNTNEFAVFMAVITQEVLGESVTIYVDEFYKSKYLIEIHFADENYYEFDFDLKSEIDKGRLSRFIEIELVREREIDKANSIINRNNVRHFNKYRI